MYVLLNGVLPVTATVKNDIEKRAESRRESMAECDVLMARIEEMTNTSSPPSDQGAGDGQTR